MADDQQRPLAGLEWQHEDDAWAMRSVLPSGEDLIATIWFDEYDRIDPYSGNISAVDGQQIVCLIGIRGATLEAAQTAAERRLGLLIQALGAESDGTD